MVALRNPSPSRRPDDATVDELFARMRAGDEQAFNRLHQRLHGQIFVHINSITQDEEVSEELTQETFTKAWTYRERTRPDTNFGAWLHRIARNKALDVVRRRQRLRFQPYDAGHHEHLLPDTPDPARQVLANETISLVQQALAALAPRDQRLLRRFYLDEQSVEDTGAEEGISRSATKSALFRARDRFRFVYDQVARGETPALPTPKQRAKQQRYPVDLSLMAPMTRQFFLTWVAGARHADLAQRFGVSYYRSVKMIQNCRRTLGLEGESQKEVYLLFHAYGVRLPKVDARWGWVVPGAPLTPLEARVYEDYQQVTCGAISDSTRRHALERVRAKLGDQFQGPHRDPLTARQRQVAEVWASGLSNRATAFRLGCSQRTVQDHVLLARQAVAAALGGDQATVDRAAMRAWLADHPADAYVATAASSRPGNHGRRRGLFEPTGRRREAIYAVLDGRRHALDSRQFYTLRNQMAHRYGLPYDQWRVAFARYAAEHPQEDSHDPARD